VKAARVTEPGGPEVIGIADVPIPAAGAGDVLVRVRASALNRADLLQRTGRYAAPPGWPADILGMEIAGEIAELGSGVSMWHKGDRVMGIVGGGGNAEFAVTRAAQLARIPENLSWEQAAATPEAFITAHDALLTQAGMKPGERVLVHAVGSGVGVAAVQLVNAFGGVCYGTARTADKVERARAFGLADGLVLGASLESLSPAVKRWTDGAGMNVILDLAGGPYMAVNVECAALQGRIMVIGLVAGRSATLDLAAILNKRITVRGTALRPRSNAERADATAAFVRDVLPLLESGAVRPVVDRVFPLAEIAKAHALMESNATFGKLVLAH
jgi:putative PIG3 family NAD(P)H quinone oxidoreductase